MWHDPGHGGQSGLTEECNSGGVSFVLTAWEKTATSHRRLKSELGSANLLWACRASFQAGPFGGTRAGSFQQHSSGSEFWFLIAIFLGAGTEKYMSDFSFGEAY